MIALSNSELMRGADETAINEYKIPSTLLMTNAAGHLAREAMALAGEKRSALIFCGTGNNGGDGIGAAVYLIKHGFGARVLLVGSRERMTADSLEMERRLNELGGAVEDYDTDAYYDTDNFGVIIDAMFGIGLNKPLSPDALAVSYWINHMHLPVVSADIASGVEADTGRILGDAVRADVTVTFSMPKPGHFVEPGCTHCGRLVVADIGIPGEVLDEASCGVFAVTDEWARLPRRREVSHKGDYGKLLIVAGSVGYTGAPSLASRAAVRAGAGLVYLGVPVEIYAVTAVKNDEAMPFPLHSDSEGRIRMDALPKLLERLSSCDVLALGPGLGRSDELTALTREMIRAAKGVVVVDADGLFALSEDMGSLKKAKGHIVLTPHEGEFVRMGGTLTGDRVSDARSFAKEHNVTLVLKGHRTITAFPDGEVWINTTGNPGMAKGGSGDVLTGIIAAFLGQFPLRMAVTAAVYIHGATGDLCAKRMGEYSMTPSDIIRALPDIMLNLEVKHCAAYPAENARTNDNSRGAFGLRDG